MVTKEVLGFTGKFYAVWNITISENEVCTGITRRFTKYIYKRKASKYLNVAQNKYPNFPLDNTLDGKEKTFWTKDYIYTRNDIFQFGKYQGQKIEDCTDTSYIVWYWKNVYDEHKAYVESILISRGYSEAVVEVTDDEDIFTLKVKQMVSGDEVALENKDLDSMSPELRKIYTASTLEFTPNRNITCNGNYLSQTENIIYKFTEYKHIPATYYAPDYYLPTINGKGVRIKNKKVVITKFDVAVNNNKIIVNIIEFKIAK